MAKGSKRARLAYVTVGILSSTFMSSEAWADCISQSPVDNASVICGGPGANGWGPNAPGYANTAVNALKITVNAGATVTNSQGGTGLLNAGTGSSVINFSGAFNNDVAPTYGIDAGSAGATAISVGGGTVATNNSNANMRGSIVFGATTGSQVNVFNNNYAPSGGNNLIANIDGNVTSAGNTTINNGGVFGQHSGGSIVQTGASGTVIINNGVVGGWVAPLNLAQNSLINGSITTEGATTLTNLGGGNAIGSWIGGNVNIGTGGLGTSTIVNGSSGNNATIRGTVTMGSATNVVTNDGTITGNVTMNGAVANTYNAGSSGSTGDNGLRLPGSAISGVFLPTGVVAGTLQGSTNTAAVNTLNLNGTGTSTMQVGSVIKDFDTVNKNNSGTWIIKNTLDGTAGQLATVNVTGGTLSLDNASFLGSAATTAKLSNGTTLQFNGTAAGTFAGNIVNATSATTGGVLVTGANATTLSGTNSYSGTTRIDGGILTTGSNGALSGNSDFVVANGGTLNINHVNTIKSLSDDNNVNNNANTVAIANGKVLTLGSGTWGAKNGTITGAGTLIKNTSGTFTLGGANAVNLTGNAGGTQGIFQIDDGSVNVNAAGAIGANTIVVVNSGNTTTGVLNVNQDDTIGGLAGTGANAQVNIASGKTLTTGNVLSTSYAGHIAGAGALTKVGATTMILKGTNSYTGGTNVQGGTLTGFAGTGAGTSSLQGNIAVSAGADVTFDQTINGASGTYAGNLSGAGSASFIGNASTVLSMTGTNTGLTGPMNFKSGTVKFTSSTSVGGGNLVFTGGTFENGNSYNLTNLVFLNAGGGTFNTVSGSTLGLNGVISGSGGLTKNGTGVLVLGGANTYSGGTTVNAGTLRGQASVGLQGNILVNSGALVNFTGTGTYAGALTGGGAVQISGGTTTFTNTGNTYSDNTTIDAGATLSAGLNTLSPNSGIIANGTLSLTGNNSITRGLGGSGTANLNGNNLSIGTSGNYNFSGQINGAGTLTVNSTGGNQWTFSGTTGTPLTAFVNNGTTVLNGSLAATTGTNASGATLSGTGTFTGNLTNNGTIRPGSSPGVFHVVGNYTQSASGTYVIDINANNSSSVTAGVDYDQIQVTGGVGTGKASLAGAAVINQNGGQFVNGTVYHILTTSAPGGGAADGIISGSFSFTNNNNVISPFITLAPNIVNNTTNHTGDYTLTVVRSAYNTVANNPNQAAVAGLTSGQGLQGLVGLASANAAIARIDNMSASDARTFFNQISPEPYAAYVRALQDQGNLFTRQVAHRMAQTAGEKDAKMGIWGNLYGQWGNGKNKSFRFGSDQDIKGGALGVDGTMGESLTLGAAVGYSQAKVDYNLGNSNGKSTSWQVGGYANYHPGNVVADLQVAYVHGKVRADKEVGVGSGFSATSGRATAHTSGNLFKVIGTVGYELGGETLGFRPFVGVDFTTGRLKGFEEGGNLGALTLDVRKQKANRTDLLLGFKFAPKMGSLQPYADATLRYGLKRNSGNVRAFFNDIPTDQFTVSGQRSAKMQGELDAGLAYGIGKNASIFFGYEGTLRKSLTEHGVNGGVKFAF